MTLKTSIVASGSIMYHDQNDRKNSMKVADKSRRRFLKTIATAPVLPALAAAQPQAGSARTLFNAIQMGAHTMLDEGIERCLDLIQETAGINALMIYSHTYHGDIRKPAPLLATDHGV